MIKKLQGISLLKKIPVNKTAKNIVVSVQLAGAAISMPFCVKYLSQPAEKIVLSGSRNLSVNQKEKDWEMIQKHIAEINKVMLRRKLEPAHFKQQKNLVLRIMNEDKDCLSKDKGKLADKIVRLAKEYGTKPVYIASIVKKESHFCENVNKGAGKGLMQVTEIAVKDMYLRPNLYHSGLNKIKEKYPTYQSLFKAIQSDSELNLRVGIIAFLQRLEKANGNVKIALQNYNASSRKIAYANSIMKDIHKYAAEHKELKNSSQKPA